MHSTRSAFLAISLPLLVVLLYFGPFSRPRVRAVATSRLGAEESSQMWDQCNTLYRAKKYEDALPCVLKLHENYPGSHIYMEMAAEIYGHLGRYQEEAQFWEKYFDHAPNPVTACPQIGDAYWKQGKEKEAVSAYQRCLALEPDNSDNILYLARALEKSGDPGQAAQLYQRGLQVSPGYTDLQMGLARVWLRLGNPAGAKSLVDKAVQKSPNNVDVLLAAGLVYSRQGDLRTAKQYLEHGVKLSEGYLDFHAALAGIAEDEKNYPEAILHYNRILQDHPDDQSTRAKRDALMAKQ